jgi:SAM-dependent methyltransferase
MEYGGAFVRTYLPDIPNLTVVDIGAQDFCGSLKGHMRPTDRYIGVDFAGGPNVDVVLSDPYKLPFDDESVDAILCSSCFEHSEFFWQTFLEMVRILKPAGLLYLNVPSNGAFHRYPVDCWRFYPDSGRALERWARHNGSKVAMLESFIGIQKGDLWNDFVAVFVKDEANASLYPKRLQDSVGAFTNGLVLGSAEVLSKRTFPEDVTMSPWKRARRNLKLYLKYGDLPQRVVGKAHAAINVLSDARSGAEVTPET